MPDPETTEVETEEAVAEDAVQEAPEGAQEEPQEEQPEESPVSFEELQRISDERLRKLQSAKDREVAELRRRLESYESQPRQQPIPQNQPQQAKSEEDFWALLEKNPDEAIGSLSKKIRDEVVTEVKEEIRREAETRERYDALRKEFSEATNGYSEAEQAETLRLLDEGHRTGRPITPTQAAVIARFGSMDGLLRAANKNVQNVRPAAPKGAPPPVPGVSDASMARSMGKGEAETGPDALQGKWSEFF